MNKDRALVKSTGDEKILAMARSIEENHIKEKEEKLMAERKELTRKQEEASREEILDKSHTLSQLLFALSESQLGITLQHLKKEKCGEMEIRSLDKLIRKKIGFLHKISRLFLGLWDIVLKPHRVLVNGHADGGIQVFVGLLTFLSLPFTVGYFTHSWFMGSVIFILELLSYSAINLIHYKNQKLEDCNACNYLLISKFLMRKQGPNYLPIKDLQKQL